MDATHWILAFDSSCGRCIRMSASVAQACDGKLEVLPLSYPDIVRWRAMSLGPNPRWAPTLLRVSGGQVRAWTGISMTGPMIWTLGPRSTVRVLQALGRQQSEIVGNDVEPGAKGVLGRALLRLGSGILVAGGLILTGMLTVGPDPARSWAKANSDRLPQTYDDFVGYSMTYRRAIYTEISPTVRSQLWVEQLNRYRIAHSQLSTDQATAIDQAITILSEESTFTVEPANRSDLDRAIQQHKELSLLAFSQNEARDLFMILGPADNLSGQQEPLPDCACHHRDNAFCAPLVCVETPGICRTSSSGCGWWWGQTCDGACFG
jgi:hypothetical protein